MSDVKHTPGPWKHDTRGYPHPDVKGANGRNVASTWGVNGQPKSVSAAESQKQIARANARLIAAAPELLEACNAAMQCIGELPPTQARVEAAQMLSAAIAKATGAQS